MKHARLRLRDAIQSALSSRRILVHSSGAKLLAFFCVFTYGGYLSARVLDLPLGNAESGSIVGSGNLVVLSTDPGHAQVEPVSCLDNVRQ